MIWHKKNIHTVHSGGKSLIVYQVVTYCWEKRSWDTIQYCGIVGVWAPKYAHVHTESEILASLDAMEEAQGWTDNECFRMQFQKRCYSLSKNSKNTAQ